MPRENGPLHHPSNWPKGSFKLHLVSHQRSAIVNFKIMVMAEAPKAPAHHAILKILRALISRDAASMCQSEPEVAALPRNLLPAPINPEVTPAMARSPLQFVEAMCKSMLRARSKQRSIGAAIDVSNTMRVIPSSGSHRRGKAQLPSCDMFRNSSAPRPSCAASRGWRALGRSRG